MQPYIAHGVEESSFPAAGALLDGTDARTAYFKCSGTLIGCSTFLTAAHCLRSRESEDPNELDTNPENYFVYMQSGGVFGVDKIIIDQARFDLPKWDIALLHLDRPVEGIAPLPLNRAGKPAYGTTGTIVGFGATDKNERPGIKRRGKVVTVACKPIGTPPLSNTTEICFDYDKTIGQPGEDSSTCDGDSGGGLYIGPDNRVAGITSSGARTLKDKPCGPGDHVFDASVTAYLDWIDRSAVNADIGTKACGSFEPVDLARDARLETGVLDSTNAQKSYAIDVSAGIARLRVALNGELRRLDDNDFDLFVARGSKITDPSKADCKEDARGQAAFCDIPDPSPGPWTAMVRRKKGAGKYQLTITLVRK